jgi:hypothetical protein
MWLIAYKGNYIFTPAVEEWMHDQDFTEVFDSSMNPYSEEEMAITRILDRILGEIVFGAGIDQLAGRAGAMGARGQTLVPGRAKAPGQQNVQTWQGNVVDGLFKERVQASINHGELAPYAHLLTVVPGGQAGPDLYARSLVVAWDVTTRGSAEEHIRRDVIRRAWDRYYLLIWDEPRTKPTWLARLMERQNG